MSLTGGDSRLPLLLPYVGMVQSIVTVFCKKQHMKQWRRKRNIFSFNIIFLKILLTSLEYGFCYYTAQKINIFSNHSFQ